MSDRERSIGNIMIVLRVLLPYRLRRWKEYLVYYYAGLVVATLSTGVAIPLFFRSFVDTLSMNGVAPDVVMPALVAMVVWIGVFAIVGVVSILISELCITYNVPYMLREMDEDAFSVIHQLSYSFFSRSFVGALVAKAKRFSEAADAIDMHMTRGMFVTFVQFVASIVILGRIVPALSIVFLVWGIVFIAITVPIVQWKMKYDAEKARQDSLVTAALADSIGNFLAIKMFAQFESEKKSFNRVTMARARSMSRSWLISSLTNFVHGFFVVVMQVAMLGLSLWLWHRGVISVGVVVLVQSYVTIIAAQFTDVGNRLKYIQRFAADCMEMIDIMNEKPEVLDPPKPEKLAIREGAIVFDNVSFAYGGRNDIFSGFSLSIAAGEKVGFVGFSGGGKTTLTRLLMRFADVTAGAIRIDGQDIRSVAQDDLRRAIGYVPQDTILFHRSIHENISYAKPDATDEEIFDAAKKAYAEEFISRLPDGYETVVGERGIQLSGGERQRIAIARAILMQNPILVLDEATSSLDSVSERYIQEALKDLMLGRTTIVIAHRLSTMRLMDRIVVMHEGRIAEQGTHEELLKSDGLYATLHAHQKNGMIGE